MAVEVDSSTPARVTNAGTSGTITTVAFSPPAAVLVVYTGRDTNVDTVISNTGPTLTWEPIGQRDSDDVGGRSGGVDAHYAVLSAPATGMTVTTTIAAAQQLSAQVYVLTGVDTADPIGGYAEGSNPVAAFTTDAFTTELADSLGIFGLNDWTPRGAVTSDDTTFSAYLTAGQQGGGSGYKTLGAAGSSATFNVSIAGTATPDNNWLSFEVRGAATTPVVEDPPVYLRRVAPARR